MFSDKIRLRVSNFVKKILENDALAFGFDRCDFQPNWNKLLNKLIPLLVAEKKSRRQKITDALEEIMQRTPSKEVKEIIGQVNSLYERLFFDDPELRKITEYIWLRPSKENETLFDEIADSETEITSTTIAFYIRDLLNEYSRLPQYRRERLLFSNERNIIQTAKETKQILAFRYSGESYKVFVIEELYTYLYEQANYVICYDIEHKCIRSFCLCFMTNLYLQKRKHHPTALQKKMAQLYMDHYGWPKGEILEVIENEE